MISDQAVALAVERALISAEQADALRATEREISASGIPESGPGSGPEPVDDEKLRFVTGFADIFVTIGIVLFLGALSYLMAAGAGSTPMFAGIAACALGAFILLLSAGWLPLRRAILRRLPQSFARRLPHPLEASHT